MATSACAGVSKNPEHPGNYPPEWWQKFPRDTAASWEILPEDAGPGEVILSKRTELGILSNFAPTPFIYHGKSYASVEGLWQMMKYPENSTDPRATFPGVQWKFTRDQVSQMTAFEAKHAGDYGSEVMKKMNINWVSFEGRKMEYRPKTPGEHYRIIVEAMWEKVKQNPEVKRILLATGDLILKPDHLAEADAADAWRYYEIWTHIRSELQAKPSVL